MAYPHRVIILRAVESVVRHNLDTLDKGTAKVVISLASHEMTKSKGLEQLQRDHRDGSKGWSQAGNAGNVPLEKGNSRDT
ncbi:hypothetical protein WISP_00823 [Willisornis vidua]|uniref:MROH2B-like N-terminal HEAT-repeats domain-containing protein n=1 Tax=Willisornis vidua TaxID=1566151 RepID=A0ABQ9E0R8_9PASS|nr:hypothetical protein WISP_00823 [Willisornis vidua]